MRDVIRWRFGETAPVIVPVPDGVRIDAGTLLYMDQNGDAIPYRLFVERHRKNYRTNFDMDIENDIHCKFLGVALSGNSATPCTCRVATRGLFEFELWTNQDRVLLGQNVYLRPTWDGITWSVSDDTLTTERFSECFFPPMGRIAQTKLVNAAPSQTLIKIHSYIL